LLFAFISVVAFASVVAFVSKVGLGFSPNLTACHGTGL
jgi:hypothetical protein